MALPVLGWCLKPWPNPDRQGLSVLRGGVSLSRSGVPPHCTESALRKHTSPFIPCSHNPTCPSSRRRKRKGGPVIRHRQQGRAETHRGSAGQCEGVQVCVRVPGSRCILAQPAPSILRTEHKHNGDVFHGYEVRGFATPLELRAHHQAAWPTPRSQQFC